MDTLSKSDKHEAVSEYYGSTLEKSDDLKTNACCTVQSYPQRVQKALDLIHPEVLDKYYGCGLTIPEELDGKRVLDLGSGGGGPVGTMLEGAMERGSCMPKIILSDAFPSNAHFEDMVGRYGAEHIGYRGDPVAAQAVAPGDGRLRSLCSVFHHFSRVDARRVVEDAAAGSDGVFIMEPFPRTVGHLLLVLLSGPFVYMAAPFFARGGFSFRKFLICTLLPIVPLMVLFDGCVSVLRTYAPGEIMAMFPASARGGFDFRWGSFKYCGMFRSTWFSAVRRTVSDQAGGASGGVASQDVQGGGMTGVR